jgi:multidrug transporter EmrE-like cation transporter
MNRQQRYSILLMIIATLLISGAQIMFKTGANNMRFEFSSFFSDLPNLIQPPFLIPVVLGFILYGAAAVMVTFALKSGELSVLYPILATGFIWVMLFAYVLFEETITMINILGVFSIIAGISAIGYGAGRRWRSTH